MSNNHQNGKGSKRRPGLLKSYGDGWDRIYGKKEDVIKIPSCDGCKHWMSNFDGSINGECSADKSSKLCTLRDDMCKKFDWKNK